MKLTPWFPPQVTPVRVGVYQACIPYPHPEDPVEFAYWDGARWGWLHNTVKQAARYKRTAHAIQLKCWRGLAEKP